MRFLLFLVFAIYLGVHKNFSQNSNRVITTGVPFLLITSDARAAGMGELGVATSADIYSQQWNPAKYAFSLNEKGLGLSYTPYLSKIVDDIFLGNFTYFKKIVRPTSEELKNHKEYLKQNLKKNYFS